MQSQLDIYSAGYTINHSYIIMPPVSYIIRIKKCIVLGKYFL